MNEFGGEVDSSEMTKAQKVVCGLTYLMNYGEISMCAYDNLFFAQLKPRDSEAMAYVTRHMESLGWEKSYSSPEDQFVIELLEPTPTPTQAK